MRYRFYNTSEKAWAGMLAAIESAQESIYLEMYILENDTAKYDFLTELTRKSQGGVHVVMILDSFGSAMLPDELVDQLRIAGVEVLFFSYWFRRMHRKILIVDERVAFLGGVNIAHRFAHWNDLQIRVSGRVVRHILHSFIRVYHECGGKDPVFSGRAQPLLVKKARLWFIEHGIGRKRYALRKHYEEHIESAERSVAIMTPYLLPHRWLITCIHRAVNRGVEVAIMIPRQTDYLILDRINYYYIDLFNKLGVTCLLSDTMNHAKIMLIDGRLGTVGSQNIDALSFDWNAEAGVFFDNPSMVHDLQKIVTAWEGAATPFTTATHPPHWYDIALALLLRLFQPNP
jgi:cardiolipin synthase